MRNRYFDFLRFLAIVRVVGYHATTWAFLSIALPAMSVMFALAGSLMAASLDRAGRGPVRAGPVAVRRRLRRLLPSLWLLAALFVPAMLLTGLPVSWRLLLWIVPIADAPSNGWGALALSAIWYLRDYLWFVLASPLALWLFRRYPLITLLAPYALLAVVEFALPAAPQPVREFGLYFGAWLLGFAHHDGLLRRLSRRSLLLIAGLLCAAGGGWIYTHPGPRGFDLNDIPLGNALWSAGFVLLALGLAPASFAWLARRPVLNRTVTVLNSRALTIYLWHMPIVIALAALGAHVDLERNTPVGLALHVVAVALLVAVAVLLFGWVEDLAAGRRPVLVPAAPAPRDPARSAAAPAPRDTPESASAPARTAPAQRAGDHVGTDPVRP
ncbi:acyltransferase [Plantactinospora sp. KBS50]|uniref:acyltransferase family protein n=1 Tax=Plantactinospora sp. KBS50 TaxID=2024580 RepID=UPI000BAB07F8|nr:acyltransferase [Plantactinospora sp. KBS50]ASW56252.1 acyltransferase [Plantactinospora sp. KBS50]